MVFGGYLAMTAAEIQRCDPLPERVAFMACHYAPYGQGLSNIPRQLPPGSILMLNDRIPPGRHDPRLIAGQLAEAVEKLSCKAVILDLQRSGSETVVEAVVGTLPCPVCVTPDYASLSNGPVLLPPVPPNVTAEKWLTSCRDRPIWLEVSLSALQITVTANGAKKEDLPLWDTLAQGHFNSDLCCHYQIKLQEDAAVFTLFRTQEDIAALCQKATDLGIECTVGLYQEFRT